MKEAYNAAKVGMAMSTIANKISIYRGVLARKLILFHADRSGNVAIMSAFLMVPLVGALGLGFEVSNWYLTTRAMQNAADAAAIAAATNAANGGSNYDVEARAVAAQYGFVNGSHNTTVNVAKVSNTTTCSSGCYSVTIKGTVPLYLSQVIGFKGDTSTTTTTSTTTSDATMNGGGIANKSLTSSAFATTQMSGATPYCLLALGSSGAAGITANGAPKANMTGCSVMSNTSATCNGHNLGATVGAAHATNNGCGINQLSNVAVVKDPYSGLAANIPNNTCSSYAQEPAKNKDPSLPNSNLWSGSKSLSGNVQICGDLQLTGDVTIDAPSGAVLVIENGQLDTNGYTLSTSSGSALTVVFSGTDSGAYTHAPTGGGTLNITAPATGAWKGVAIYQDPSLTSGVDVSAAGNSPTWDITGLVYLPHASVTFSGAVNKSSSGQSCFVLVADNVTINGTGSILANGQCGAAGLTMPSGSVPKVQLVSF